MNKEPSSLGDIISWIITTPIFGGLSWALFFSIYQTQKGIEAALCILFGLLFGLCALMLLIVLIREISYRHKYMKQKPMNDAIKAFNNGKNRTRWFTLTGGLKPTSNSNGRVIRTMKLVPRRMCCVDEYGMFHIKNVDWWISDDFTPGKYIVSNTTGKLTFMYLEKNY